MLAPHPRTAIVTGAARGIGRAISLALARQGFAVALVDVLEGELEHTAEEIREFDVDALPLFCDVADHQQAHAQVGEIVHRWGRIDVLVNNAAMPQTSKRHPLAALRRGALIV